MNILEKVGDFISKRGEDLQKQISGVRVFSAYITNATDDVLQLIGQPILSHARHCRHFASLQPGEAGVVSFSHDGEHGGALQFRLGDDTLFLGQYMRASYSSLFGSDQFVVEFSGKTLNQFYAGMPQEFMGVAGRGTSRAMGLLHSALVRQARASANSEVEVILVAAKDVHVVEELDSLDSLQQLALAECGGDLLCSALFVEEFNALRDGMEHSKSFEQAYASDLLIAAMVSSGLCGAASQKASAAWQGSRSQFPTASRGISPYRYYSQLPTEMMASHLAICHGLLRATALRCSAQLEPLVSRQKASAQWPPRLARHRGPQQAAHTNFATNDAIMATHLAGSGGLERRSTASRVSVCAGESAESTDRFLQGLVRSCVEDTCHAMLARGQLLHRAGGGSAAMQAYMTSLPLSKRHGHSSSGQFAMFCSEIFQNLERQTGAEAVLESLGEASGEYKSLSTNSKSGEFFFLSNDRKFLIKTVSESEGLLLVRMLPEYQDHIHSLPASLIVRFAGLFSVELPGPNQRYFLIMKSVFDPACEIHSNYDLKGSLYHRKKKDGESTGKDEDWIAAQLRLSVPEVQRRAMLEAHEADVQFLKSHSVMDYSVLVGIHYPERASSKMTTSTGIVSADGKEVYFVGLIDFLIHFGLKKQAEHLLRAAQGHGDDTSCVDPTDYAARQAKFLRSSVFRAPVALEDDWGTAGRLRVEVLGARNLRNADVVGASDPYVRVSVGLQRAQTPAIQDELNPTWNCSLTLPLNKHHFYDELEFTVWDLDSVRVAQGSDDYLGILKVPMAKVWHGDLELKQKLEETPTGELHVKARLDRDPGPSAGYAPAGSAGYAPAAKAPARAGAARWEFAVRHGFEGFDPRCQQTLEECYQRFLAGGASAVQVTSGRAQVTVDFRAMTQQTAGGRTRPVHRVVH